MTDNYPDDWQEWDTNDPRSPVHEEVPDLEIEQEEDFEPDEDMEQELNFE